MSGIVKAAEKEHTTVVFRTSDGNAKEETINRKNLQVIQDRIDVGEGVRLCLSTLAKMRRDTSLNHDCLLYTSPSPRDVEESRMPSSA